MTAEKRAELVVELDKVNTEIKSLAKLIRGAVEKLDTIMTSMRDDVYTNVERLGTGYSREPPEWQPSEFDLAELKQSHSKPRELLKKRNELEGQLGVTIM